MVIPEALIEKYAAERAKRLRPEQVARYVDFKDAVLADMDTDPYVDHDALASRGYPLSNGSEVKVLIAGAGMLGLMAAHRLLNDDGISSTDLVLVDKAGGFGGTWYWNRYPGVACDIEGYSYVPLLEETGYMPKHRYRYGQEIRDHLERIARMWNIQGQFCTTVTDQRWDDVAKRWIVTLSHDLGPGRKPQELTINYLCTLGGWDWSKSGGSQENPDMAKLQGKRVGIIGTGATSVQVAPHLAKWAKHTHIFQRTPSYVGPQVQKETTATYWADVANEPKWQYKRMKNLDGLFTGKPDIEDNIQDGWSKVSGMRAMAGFSGKIITPAMEKQHIKDMMDIDYEWTEAMRSHVDALVDHPSTAQKLKAWYPGFCKRPTFHETYFTLFNQSNVTLVDTDGKGVQAYTSNGVLANDCEYELDVLILATGYTVGLVDSCPSSALSAPLAGRDGKILKCKWDGEDYGTLFGAMTNGFPNLFFASGSGGSVSQNAHSFYSLISRLISYTVKESLIRANNPDTAIVEVKKGTEDAWSAEIAKRSRWFAAFPSCTPGYLTGEGLVQRQEDLKEEEKYQLAISSYWGEGILNFQEVVDNWIVEGKLQGLTVNS
ncbi:unnamed protein product [Clonostachys rosea]|uniref:FAD/NAD(P)-binding domain-containing protein n=1 Tax=Bionectria ochroleuca TaxID=29856 RepID=A0ABY6UQ34_BIOOC|nr:unnamed protein product [Clonostachys rosea]